MQCTKSQYEVMELLEKGFLWDDPDGEVAQIIWHLEREGLAGARVDLKDDYWTLTEKGRAYLAEIRLLEEQVKKEAEKAACEDAKKEKQQRFENKLAIANLLVPLIIFIIGLLIEHFFKVIDFATDIWRYFFG